MTINPFPMTQKHLGLVGLVFILLQFNLNAQIKAIKPFRKISALIVGISDYQNDKIPDLAYAHRDAEAFAQYLQSETAWKVKPENLVLLTNASATYGKFLNELQSLVDNTEPNDRLIFYFSGHGDIERVGEDLMGYLLFYDVSPTTYASGGACMVTTLNDYLERLVLEKGAEVIFISDACRSGSLAGSNTGGPRATTAALSELFTHTTKLLSCEPDQVSVEGPDWGGGRGLFSYYMVKGLKGFADLDGDYFVDKFELERYVQDSVRKASNRRQLPSIKGLSSTRLSRIDRKITDQQSSELERSEPLVAARPDTNFLPQLARFETALSRKQLLYPEEGSANQIYESLGDHPAAQAVKKIMKITLASALQDEAQRALNEYIVSPGKELARRWADQTAYAYYPDYLGRAAELLGEDNYFYGDIKSREHYFRGVNLRLQYDQGKEDQDLLQAALAEQQTALRLQPIAPHVYNEMGLLYKRLGQDIQAIGAFQQALNLSPRWTLALTNLGFTYEEMEQYPQAEKIYQDAIQLDTTFALSHYNLAVLYEKTGQIDQSRAELEKTIRFDPKFAEAYFNLGNFSVGEPIAEQYLLTYIQLRPQDADGFNLLGYLYHTTGQFDKAKQAYQSALMIDPDSFYTLSSLSYVFKKLEDYDAAIALWNQFLERKPEQLEAYLKLSGVQALSGAPDAALATLRKLLDKGYRDYEGLLEDADTRSLKNRPAYQQLISTYFPEKE